MEDPVIKERLANLYKEVIYAPPREFGEAIVDSVDNFKGIVRMPGLTAE